MSSPRWERDMQKSQEGAEMTGTRTHGTWDHWEFEYEGLLLMDVSEQNK